MDINNNRTLLRYVENRVIVGESQKEIEESTIALNLELIRFNMKKNLIVNETKQIIVNMFSTVSADVSVIMKMLLKIVCDEQ